MIAFDICTDSVIMSCCQVLVPRAQLILECSIEDIQESVICAARAASRAPLRLITVDSSADDHETGQFDMAAGGDGDTDEEEETPAAMERAPSGSTGSAQPAAGTSMPKWFKPTMKT